MSRIYDQTWAVEQQIMALLQADSTLWTNINGQFYEGGIPKGVATRQPAIFAIVREVALPDADLIMHNVDTPTDRSLLAWNSYDYEVIVTGETESYGEVLAGNASRIYTDLHNTQGTVDGNEINLFVIGTFKKRYVRDGRVFKELGHKVRALVQDAGAGWKLSNRVYFLFGNPGSEADLAPFCASVHFERYIDSNGVAEHNVFTLEGFASEGGNTLTNLQVDLNTANKNFIYGPYGNAAGKRQISSGTNAASLVRFEYIHGAESPSGPALGPVTPLRWRAVIDSPAAQFTVF
jgi:hypothetical protein